MKHIPQSPRKRMSFFPVPTALIDNQPFQLASDVEAWLHMWGKLERGEPISIRGSAKWLGWTRYATEKMASKVRFEHKAWKGKGRQTVAATRQPPVSRGDSGLTSHIKDDSATHQPPVSHSSAKEGKDTIYSIINNKETFPLPLGKGLNPKSITKKVLQVWSSWHAHNPRARSIRRVDVSAIRQAMRLGHTTEELQAIIDYAFTAPLSCPKVEFWRSKGYCNLNNLLNSRVLDDNHELAQSWKRGELRESPRIHRRQRPLGITALPPMKPNHAQPGYDQDGIPIITGD